MNNRKYHTAPEILLAQGQAIMSSSDESKFLFRVFAVNMVLSGTSASDVGASAGYSKAAVTGWVKTVDEKGFDALRPQQKSGRPPKLSPEQLTEIDRVLQNEPSSYGFKVWDGPTLSSYIKSQYHIDMGVRQCQRLFHSLGYSQIRPQPYPGKGYEDSQEREEFKKTHRNRRGRIPDPCISGRGSLSDTVNCDICMVQKRKCSYRQILSRAAKSLLQRFCHSGKRRIVYMQA